MAHLTGRELSSAPFADVYVRARAMAGSPRTSVEYASVCKQSIPTTGLSPPSPTSLWAADQILTLSDPKTLSKRAHNPLLKEAGLTKPTARPPLRGPGGWGGRLVRLACP